MSDPIETVRVQEIPVGNFYRKPKGQLIYLKVSPSVCDWSGLDPSYVYGVNGHGSLSKDKPGQLVVPCTLDEFTTCYKSDPPTTLDKPF